MREAVKSVINLLSLIVTQMRVVFMGLRLPS